MPLSSRPEAKRRQLQNLRPNPQNLRPAPPAPPGNARARKHGAYARVAHARLEAKQREVFDALAEDAPLRDPDGGLPAADSVTVALLAQALCRLEDVGAYLTNHGLLDGDGQVRAAVDIERRLRLEAADHAAAMGMNPAARMRLGLDLVRQHDLAQEMAALADAEEVIDG